MRSDAAFRAAVEVIGSHYVCGYRGPQSNCPSSADALAFPSVKEGFGLAVLEAMSAELPVVASDLSVFREYLVPDRDALMPPVGDVPALADALHAVATDATLRADLVAAGRSVAERFSWKACAEEHRAAYARLLPASS